MTAARTSRLFEFFVGEFVVVMLFSPEHDGANHGPKQREDAQKLFHGNLTARVSRSTPKYRAEPRVPQLPVHSGAQLRVVQRNIAEDERPLA